MRKTLLLAALALPLAACATSPYGYGSSNPLGAILGSIGSMGGAYGGYGGQTGYGYGGGNFSQAAVNACAGTAARYGQVRIREVRQVGYDSVKVWGNVYGYRNDSWDCTFRSDGRITDFDI
jgi:hypothetical protein